MKLGNHLKLPTATPKQQLANRDLWNVARSRHDADFFTIGYTGRKSDELAAVLIASGVRTVMDVRQIPVSMFRPEVSKKNLRAFVEAHGMNYVHLPELGVPRDIRARAIETGSRDTIWKWYDKNVVLPQLRMNLHRFMNAIEHPVAMLCVEIDPHECHRHRISLALEQMGFRGFDL
jgi:uncharacterized protein (DUF488 family)